LAAVCAERGGAVGFPLVTKDAGQWMGRGRAGQRLRRRLVRGITSATAALVIAAGGVPSTVPRAEAADSQSARQVTFSGYVPLPDGTGRVVVHLTARPEFQVSRDGTQVTVKLLETSVGVSNNRNPLDVSQFNVLLLRAQLVPRGGDVDLVLKLRSPAELQVTIVETPEDGVCLYVAIPSN
jgi:hypothetical protein